MLKKVSLVLSVLAALGFAVAISAPADAKEQQKGTKSPSHVTRSVNSTNVRVNTRTNFRTNKIGNVRTNVRTNRIGSSSSKFLVGHRYGSHTFFGHNRHRWHGRWYAYGEGECWINIEGEWFWNELVCPL